MSELATPSGKAPTAKTTAATSSFNRKCSLLTQYLKEKGGFGDLSLGMIATNEGGGSAVLPRTGQVKSMDLFPHEVRFGSDKEENLEPVLADNTRFRGSTRKAETAQMTIFYAGQVIVFDDFLTDKAKEVMLLARRSSSQRCPASVSDVNFETNKARDEPSHVTLPIPRTLEPVACDLPIVRRNSLHRFLEKRKDRITTTAPYPQINNTIESPGAPLSKPKPMESNNKSWLSLSAQSH